MSTHGACLSATCGWPRVNPYVSIGSNDAAHVDVANSQLNHVIFHSSDEIRVSLEQEPVNEFAVLEVPGMQRYLAVIGIHLLHLCRYHVALLEVRPHIQLVFLVDASLHTARLVY